MRRDCHPPRPLRTRPMVLPVERDEQVDTVNIPSPRVVLHVDLDAFFVQVERSLNPTLIGAFLLNLNLGPFICPCRNFIHAEP